MARIAKPWFNKGKGWWMAWVAGKQRKLAQGRSALKEARQRLRELLTEFENNPSLDSDRHTVASVIDAYLELATGSIAPSTRAIKEHYLQLFAEAHGFRAVADAKPIHLTQWLHGHPEWASDWTKAHAVSVIQAAFNWAARQELLERNPFRGVAARDGQPRRPLTRDEFQAILRKSAGRGKRRPTPAARFRQILVFLWFTGARPSEAAKLRWTDVDVENGLIVLTEHKTSHTQRTPRPRVSERSRIPLGQYRGLAFGMILHPTFSPEVFLGATTRCDALSRDHHGPRAVLNALERLARSYESEAAGVRQELAIAETQFRDYQVRFGESFPHDAYLAELTSLRDALRACLSGASPPPKADTGPTMLELADRIKSLRTTQTIEAMPQRTGALRGSMAAEPITEQIRRRMDLALTV